MSDFTKLNRLERVPRLNRCGAKALAVWSYLHHALDRRGRVVLGGAHYRDVLVRRLAVQTADRQWFYAALRELEGADLLVVEDDVLQLIGHAGAPKAPADLPPTSDAPTADLSPTSPGPSADLSATSSTPPPDLPPTSPGPPRDLSSGSARNDSESLRESRVEKSRKEESRGEGDPPNPHPPRIVRTREPTYDPQLGVPPPQPAEDRPATPAEVRQVLGVFEAAWTAATKRRLGLLPNREFQRASEVLGWARGERPDAPLDLVREAAEAACRDQLFRREKRPWWAFSDQPARHLPPVEVGPEPLSVRVFRELYERGTGSVWPGPKAGRGSPPDEIDRWALAEAQSHRCSPAEVITCSIRRWSRDEWVSGKGYPWAAWALAYREHWRPEDLAAQQPRAAGGGS